MMRRLASLLLWLALLATASARGDDTGVADLRSQVEQVLRTRHPDLTRVELTPLLSKRGRSLPDQVSAVDVDLISPAVPRRVKTRLRVLADDKVYTVWWAVKAYRPVLVAQRTLRPLDTVTKEDVALGEREIAGKADTLAGPTILSGSGGHRVTRLVIAGSVLRHADLEAIPAVARDQRVQVNVIAGAVRIETAGVAQEDGRLGQRIKVGNPGSGEAYLAEVTGAGEVTVGRVP